LITVYGGNCQYSTNSGKAVGSLVILAFFTGFMFSLYSMVKARIKIREFGALTTTFFQITLGFLLALIGECFNMYGAFSPTRTEFWTIKASSFCLFIACIQGIGSASNISLLWIEISANTGMKILTNVQKTKPAFLAILISLNCLFVLLLLFRPNYRVSISVLLVYFAFTLVAFGIGARSVSKLFHYQLAGSDTEEQRNEAKTREVTRILMNAKSLCIFGLLYFCFSIPFILTFQLQISWISFPLTVGMKLCTFFLGLTVIFHLRGECFVTWRFEYLRKCRLFLKAEPINPLTGSVAEHVRAKRKSSLLNCRCWKQAVRKIYAQEIQVCEQKQ